MAKANPLYSREIPRHCVQGGRAYSYAWLTVDRLATYGAGDAARLLRRLRPRMTRGAHRLRAGRFEFAADRCARAWRLAFESACLGAFGRAPQIGDYRISGIGREEFPEAIKRRLRALAGAQSTLRDRARAHAHAARFFRNLAGER
jgi:hypothetical protein